MATEKVYRLTIQSEAAGQQVEALRKKVAELDKQLEGVAGDSDIGRGIVADLAKAVAELEAAEGKVAGFAQALDNLKPGTLPALRAEIEELEAELGRATRGTAEFEAAVHKLGASRAELKSLEDRLDILADTKQHAAAFADLANGVVGGFTIMTTAATAFTGLSEEAAAAYTQKLIGLVSIMQSVEAISRATSSETMGVAKAAWAGAKGWLGFGDAAQKGSLAARGAVAATGVGLILLALSALVALWQDFGSTVKGSESSFTKWKGVVMGSLGAALAVVKDFLKYGYQLLTLDFSGAMKTAEAAGTNAAKAYTQGKAGVIDEARRKELTAEAEQTDRLLDILKARGADTLVLEIANAKKKLAAQKNGSKEQLDAARDYFVLKAELEKRADDEHQAARLTFMNGLIAAESARGADGYRQQLAAKREQMRQLR